MACLLTTLSWGRRDRRRGNNGTSQARQSDHLTLNVRPFRIDVPQDAIDDLRQRLVRTRWPDAIDSADWAYGTDLPFLQELVSYWSDQFDWAAQEAALNTLHHYQADVDGVRIHYVHERGAGLNPLPLVITHGWPGSFVEMVKIIPLLTDPGRFGGDEADAFDVIVPSVPGFGFSEHPRLPGTNATRVARLWAALMQGLGYTRYGAQGGDIGAGISTWLAYDRPQNVVGLHLNFIPGSYTPSLAAGPLTDTERAFLDVRDRWLQTDGGYSHVQSTKPQSLAYGLNDSPAGLAAWLLEKYRSWSDCAGDVRRRFTHDEVLTNISVYWFTKTIGSSMRYYFENRTNPVGFHDLEPMTVPCAVAVFPKELPMPPKEHVARFYKVTRWTEFPRGGHFAALEEPHALAADIRAFFRDLRR
jgi:pimeloyl-ACP methyl ester carboxylesterase